MQWLPLTIFAIAWRVGVGDPDFLGWATTVGYLIAAVLCGKAARAAGRRQTTEDGGQHPVFGHRSWVVSPRSSATPWWIMTGVVVFLGINKQLDFQTLLIELGRNAAKAEGWYQYRRAVQAAFVVTFTLLLAGALTLFLIKWRWFLKEYPLAVTGIILLVLYAVLRASIFNHLEGFLRHDLHDRYWSWVIELMGAGCIVWCAVSNVCLEVTQTFKPTAEEGGEGVRPVSKE